MTQARNKVDWCLRKAEKDSSGKHRGLVKVNPDKEKAKEYIIKAEHYLRATEYLKEGKFSDISTSTVFYAMYHSLLAIALKFGYASQNQECTFALIYKLIEEGKIGLKEELLSRISSLDTKSEEQTSIEAREQHQYGTELSIKDDLYNKLMLLAKEVIAEVKEIVEE